MALPKFAYLTPRTLKEASIMLAEHEDKARVLAGGTDLLIRMQHRTIHPDFIISLNRIPGIDHVTMNHDATLTIGACAKIAAVGQHPDVRRLFPALAHAASVTATVQIRNMGTVVGNICNASPSADTATPLLIYDALAVIVHPGGERTLPLCDFFRGPGLTALEPGEIVKELVLTKPAAGSGSCYEKLSARSAVDIAAVGVSACISENATGLVTRARIAIGAVAPVPKRVCSAEKHLMGKIPTDTVIAEAAALVRDEAAPIGDMRASEAYRKKMVEVLTVRALSHCTAVVREQGRCA